MYILTVADQELVAQAVQQEPNPFVLLNTVYMTASTSTKDNLPKHLRDLVGDAEEGTIVFHADDKGQGTVEFLP